MIPWIQVYSNLPQHPKTTRLADELGLTSASLNPNVLAVGLLVSLWTWAIQNAHNGDLSGCSHRAIAEACLWKKKPETLVNALVKVGFLDKDMKLHDWEEYACLLMEQEENRRAKTRDRVKRYRDRKSAEVNGDCNANSNASCNVTETQGNAPTIPDITKPDHVFSGGGDESAQARDDVLAFCQGQGLELGTYFGVTDEVIAAVKAFTAALFSKFTSRLPTEADEGQVFQALRESVLDGGRWKIRFPPERKKLLMYAFEKANAAGKPGDWNYIGGILENLRMRNITTLAQAQDYDEDRNTN